MINNSPKCTNNLNKVDDKKPRLLNFIAVKIFVWCIKWKWRIPFRADLIVLYYKIHSLFKKDNNYTPSYQDIKVLFDKLLNVAKVERG